MDDSSAGLIGGGLAILINLIIFAVVYIYFGYTFMVIAKKTGTENAWWAWIPILNMILMINIAQKPIWWIILFFIPVANFIASILIMMSIAERCGKPGWVGILVIVPVIGIFIPAYLAFG
ncbi:MAG TPA: DUF5684 domain-containing protein [Candidatus Eremiobacteraeota bacterium]|nr:MAG: hypothetical protein BWY64_00223 [bacterium ADurb.Bin363]HPZ07566.1 DUF5684 domain-containing protein [Candidatus Eremiobacteraeota bacterium]